MSLCWASYSSSTAFSLIFLLWSFETPQSPHPTLLVAGYLLIFANHSFTMSTKTTLMSMPHEVLLIILTFYFRDTIIRVCSKRNRHSKRTNAKISFPACMSVLLVNKMLHQIGLPCHYGNTTLWSDTIFSSGAVVNMSWVYQQMTWENYKCISGSPEFASRLLFTATRGSLSIQHLREVDIHHKSVIYRTQIQNSWQTTRHEIPPNYGHKITNLMNEELANMCRINNIRLRNLITITVREMRWLGDIPERVSFHSKW